MISETRSLHAIGYGNSDHLADWHQGLESPDFSGFHIIPDLYYSRSLDANLFGVSRSEKSRSGFFLKTKM